MSEDITPSVMRCLQCNKPFDKASSLKRHGYYCRTRKLGGQASKVRSCLPCVSGKARCDRKRPECSRCLDKGIDCRYAANGPMGSKQGSSQQIAESVSARSSDRTSSRTNSPPINIPEDDFMLPLEAGSGGTKAALDWAEPQDAELFGFEATLGRHEFTAAPSPKLPQFHLPPMTLLSNQPFPLPKSLPFPNGFTIPRSPSSSSRSLIRRPKLKTGAQRVASLVCHTLKSYPLMMMRDKTLPPFIHPLMLLSESGAQDMEPLHNCISLMNMLQAGLQGSRKLFWRNVRQECERLYRMASKLSYLEVVAGLQALSLYIIMLLDDGEAEENDIDGLLIMAVIIVNMVVVFEPAAMCDLHADGLILSPLPARRQLWEAETASKWMSEIERDLGSQTDYGMTVSGDLVKVSESPANSNTGEHGARHRQKADWEEWLAGMDSFGGLVMLAASLVG
ncbi:hypothetical protein PG991_011903 [Apiospora marii]|uniref:Zn(2)-C6 fungal-type domain-containing protein n=1 Tax=Apiospora marii TaxID=335849 RepID=A0ABR1RFF8_9PEZI